jgi:Tfp pilus assembly protein PilZ
MKTCPNCSNACDERLKECPQCGTDFVYIEVKRAREKASVTTKKERREQAIKRIVAIAEVLDDRQLETLLAAATDLFERKSRAHPRIGCLIATDYVTRKRAYQDYVKDISLGGVFIETREKFDVGEDITLTLSLSHHFKPFKMHGIIVRADPQGIGVRFETVSALQQDLIKDFVAKIEKFNSMKGSS